MPRNVEIKVRTSDLGECARRVAVIADQGPIEIAQDDTFFACVNGRLKLRVFADGTGELIFYRRTDQHGPKESFYVIAATQEPDSLRDALSLAYGQTGRVRKKRTLFLVGRTRIHLDRVEDLGEFFELEVVLADAEPLQIGIDEANGLMEKLRIDPSKLVEDAYIDLLSTTHPDGRTE